MNELLSYLHAIPRLYPRYPYVDLHNYIPGMQGRYILMINYPISYSHYESFLGHRMYEL